MTIQQLYSPPQVARKSGIGVCVILKSIANGELKATNQNLGGARPRWKISADDWQEFLDRRSNQAGKPKPEAKR